MDSLRFVGDDAVHTNYHLKIVLSSDHITREFEYLLSDFPFLADNSVLLISDTMVAENGFFWVGDFNSDMKMDIYLCLPYILRIMYLLPILTENYLASKI